MIITYLITFFIYFPSYIASNKSYSIVIKILIIKIVIIIKLSQLFLHSHTIIMSVTWRIKTVGLRITVNYDIIRLLINQIKLTTSTFMIFFNIV